MLQFRKQQQVQMLFTLLYISLNILTPTKGFPCNVTENNKTLETFSIIGFQSKCYLFGKKQRSYENAYYFCSKNKGVLTDADSDFGFLIEKALNESSTLEDVYWIGLFWTKIWDKYIWASGANYDKPKPFKNNLYGSCVKLFTSSKQFENVDCDNKLAPICMFSPKTADINDNESSRCSHVCEAVQGTYGQTTTALTTTLITTNSSLETVNTTTSPLIPTTTEGNTTSTSKNCFSTECDCDNGHAAATKTPLIGQEESLPSTNPLAVLAALLTASLLANVIAFVMFYRTRCKTQYEKETHQPISMVDILSVDSSSLNQANANHETRVGYDIYANPDGESPGYQDMDPKMSDARNITRDIFKGASAELDSQPYSQLDREGSHKMAKASEERNVYGPESVMAATSKTIQDLGIALKQENSADALNVYSN